jgi:hypothetical protein
MEHQGIAFMTTTTAGTRQQTLISQTYFAVRVKLKTPNNNLAQKSLRSGWLRNQRVL